MSISPHLTRVGRAYHGHHARCRYRRGQIPYEVGAQYCPTFEWYFLRYVTYRHYSSSLPSSSTDQFSVGAFADSAHEYLLKQWLMSSRSEPKARDLCRSQPYKYLSSNTHIFIFLRPSRLGQYHQTPTLPLSITEPSLCDRHHSQCSQPHYGAPIVFPSRSSHSRRCHPPSPTTRATTSFLGSTRFGTNLLAHVRGPRIGSISRRSDDEQLPA